jgi:NTE family protein
MTVSDSTRNGITLVLGTGFLKCAASLGLMQVLRRENIPVREIVAASTGAIFAAAIGLDYPANMLQEMIARMGEMYRDANLSWRHRLQIFLPRFFGFNEQFGLVNNSEYLDLFKHYFGGRTFAESRVPLYVIVTNFANGKRVVIDNGPLWSALAATSSALGLFPPVSVNGQMLIDGAATEPLPIAVAMEREAQVIVTMGFENPTIDVIHTLPNYTHQFRNIFVNQLLNAQVALYTLAHYNEIIPITPKFGAMIGQTDTQLFSFVVQKGVEATEALVPYLKTLVSNQSEVTS